MTSTVRKFFKQHYAQFCGGAGPTVPTWAKAWGYALMWLVPISMLAGSAALFWLAARAS